MTSSASLLDHLNPQQRAAVTAGDGPMLVIAGAGSGKTRVITHRIAWLIRERNVAPWQIFAATFTNKAAGEMRDRVGSLVPGSDLARLSIATFHSLCVGILRREAHHVGLTQHFTICDDTDQMALIKECLRNLEIPKSQVDPKQARQWIAAAKIRLLDPEAAQREFGAEMGPDNGRVYALYQEQLLRNDAVDFDDLIGHVVKIFREQPDVIDHYRQRWRYVLVDEYQDTNRVQFELVQLLAGEHGNICAVGDEDQSIYSWRGAEIDNLLRFPERFEGTQVIRLEQNYRSTETILEAAGAVIAYNNKRMGKDLWSERGRGEPITLTVGRSERDEAAQVVETMDLLHRVTGLPYRDMAVFYRINALSRGIEDQLRQRGIPYRVIGGMKFYDRAEVKDLLAYLRLVANPRDGVALSRVLNKPTRGIGAKTQANLTDAAIAAHVGLWDILERAAADPANMKMPSRAREGVRNLIAMVEKWRHYHENHTPHALLKKILRDTQYEESLGDERSLEVISRIENIGELVSAVKEFHKTDPTSTLEDYLERVALIHDTDDLRDDDAVSLMTLHCAKGLEYRAVFIVAMEEPIFPSGRALDDQGHFEEERRLFYVGITRAKDLLFLSRADGRNLYGRTVYNPPSLFLRETPAELMRPIEDARRQWFEESIARGDAATEGPAPVFRESESSEAIDDGLFPIGTRIVHDRLGEGEIVGASGQGKRRKINVRFDAGIEVEILEAYGGLQPAPQRNDLPF